MLNTHLHDEGDIETIGLEEVIDELRQYIKYDAVGYAEIPLDLYLRLEEFGLDTNELINQLEKDIQHGESDFYYSYWGC